MTTLATFACSLTPAACFLACVPRHRTWFTPLGAGTLYAYLLHGFLAQTGWYGGVWLRHPTGAATLTLLAAALTTALCTPPVRHLCQAVLEKPLRRTLTQLTGR
ncbi:hypothetical protein ACWEQW_26075 [Streptomyces nigra]